MNNESEQMPQEFGIMHYDRWTSSYRDTYNDIFVGQRFGHKMWSLTSRGPGNSTVKHSKHRSLTRALIAANNLYQAAAS